MEIIHEDKYIIAVNKPPGTPAQKDLSGDSDMLSKINKLTGRECYIIHRLDRPVGGVLLFAKDKASAASLNSQIADNKMEKSYWAAVNGIAPEEKELRDYIVKIGRLNISKIANKDNPSAKEAILYYKALSYNREENASLLSVRLVTGRHHQIRAQLANDGFYILGDAKYGKNSGKYEVMGLYSKEISFAHPKTGALTRLFAPCPQFNPFNIFELIYNKE